MKTYWEVDVEADVFLISALVEHQWSASHPCRFNHGTHWIRGWVDSRTGLDDMEK
jgi:hypothetical protein